MNYTFDFNDVADVIDAIFKAKEEEEKTHNLFGIPYREINGDIVFSRKDYLRLIKTIYRLTTANKPTLPAIRNVFYDGKTTVVMWDDNTKTIVNCQEDDAPNMEHGISMAIVKKAYGNKSGYNDVINDALAMGAKSFAKAIAKRTKKQAKKEQQENDE